MPRRLEDMIRAEQIDAPAKVELGLRLAGNDRGKMIDDIRPLLDELADLRGVGDIDRASLDREGRGDYLGHGEIGKRYLRDRLPAQLAALG